jgi:hypothetical protein
MSMSRRQVVHAGLAGLVVGALGSPSTTALANRPRASETDMLARITKIFKTWDDIGEHRTGTAGDLLTADWLADEIRARGAPPVLNAFTFERRVFTDAYVECDGNRAEGVPCYDGGHTQSPIDGPLAPLEHATGIGICDYLPYERSAMTRPMMEARERGGHAAIVAISVAEPASTNPALLNAESYRTPFGPPVLQVGLKHRPWLVASAQNHRPARISIRQHLQTALGVNVLASIPGKNQRLAPVVVMTPRSSWWHSTSERGGGIAVWLEAIGALTRNATDRPVYFTANTGHELGHLGMEAYLKDRADLVEQAHLWVHLGANFAARGVEIRYQASDAEWIKKGLTLLEAERIEPKHITPLGTRPFGEARDIFDGGGHFVSLLGANPLFHHPDDRWPEAVDLDQAAALTRAMVQLIRDAASA